MMFLFWFLLVLTGICVLLLVPALHGGAIYDHYRGNRTVTCPQTHGPAAVRIDALHAAVTAVFDREKLRLSSCSLWPERMGCDQACIREAALIEWPRITKKSAAVGSEVHYLAVLAAAAAYWLIHAVWYSHYFFRSAWMDLMGYSEEHVQQMILLLQPQMATLIWGLCFSYVLAWIMARNRRHGFLQGLEAGLLAWPVVLLAIVITVVYQGLPAELTLIYGSSTLIGSLVVGAILGTWTRGRILHALGEE